jgi:hypothetical protein
LSIYLDNGYLSASEFAGKFHQMVKEFKRRHRKDSKSQRSKRVVNNNISKAPNANIILPKIEERENDDGVVDRNQMIDGIECKKIDTRSSTEKHFEQAILKLSKPAEQGLRLTLPDDKHLSVSFVRQCIREQLLVSLSAKEVVAIWNKLQGSSHTSLPRTDTSSSPTDTSRYEGI